MRRFIALSYIILCLLMCASCHIERPDSFEPELCTGEALYITRTEATLTGFIVLRGKTEMPELRFLYGRTEAVEERSEPLAAPDGRVTLRLTGLKPGVTYYFCLESSRGELRLRSEVRSFTMVPNGKPTVGSVTLLSQGPASIIANYEITDGGGEPLVETGVYVNTGGSDERVKVQPEAVTDRPGTYRIRIGNLQQHTDYELRAFAANTAGETVGEPTAFTTGDAVILGSAGELDELLGEGKYRFTTLTLSGPLNGDDVCCLRRMMGLDIDGSETAGQLVELDLTDADIVAGGGSYDNARFTEDGVIGQGMFAGCTRLQRVDLPNSVTKIEKDAFRDCTSLREIAVPASVTELTPSDGCTALERINVSAANTCYRSIDGVLLNADATAFLWFPMGKKDDYTLPATITALGDYAFKGCAIGRFTVPATVTAFGQAVFADSRVEEVILPDNLRLVPTATFQNCTRLTTVHLGSATELVSDYAFDGCPLTDLYVSAAYPPVCNANTFTSSVEDLLKTCTLHVSTGRKNLYRADSKWGKFKYIVDK